MILGVLGCFGITAGVMSAMKNNPAYKDGVAKAKANSEVKAALGEPIEAAWWAAGGIEERAGGAGKAAVVTTITGPKDTGVLTIEATKANGVWTTSKAVIVIGSTGKVINLVGSSDGGKTGDVKTEGKTDADDSDADKSDANKPDEDKPDED